MNTPKGRPDADIVVLYCQHCLAPNAEMSKIDAPRTGPKVRAVMLPCSSKIQTPDLLKLLDQGADGVEVVACSEKGCRFLVGSCKAEQRVDFANSLLASAGVKGSRLGITRKAGLSANDILQLAEMRATVPVTTGDK